MKNPWKEIALSDYENHMKLDSVMQLQALNAMMKNQLHLYLSETVMILGIAGGNGLEHVDTNLIRKVYGVDINSDYLFVSDSPYIHVFDHLDEVHHQMQVNELTACMRDISYGLIAQKEEKLPNGKCLVQLDFKRQHKQQSSISQLPKMTDSLIVKS